MRDRVRRYRSVEEAGGDVEEVPDHIERSALVVEHGLHVGVERDVAARLLAEVAGGPVDEDDEVPHGAHLAEPPSTPFGLSR